MDVELKHTWRISKQAWYIRLYLWVWGAEEADVTFCKLWWAYVFMWLALPIRLVLCGYDRTKRTSLRVIRALKHLFRVSRQKEDVLVALDAPVQPVRHKPYVALYPGERVGERSVVGEFLATLIKPLRAKMMEPRFVAKDRPPEHEDLTPDSMTMQRILEGIATGAASLSMKCRAVSYAIGHGIRDVASKVALGLLAGVLLVGDVLVKPVAYGAGGLAAFFMCTGKLLWAGVDRSLPYVDRMFELIGRAIWFSLWPVRKTLSWTGRYLGKAGTVLAISWSVIAMVGYIAAVLYVVGVSIILHPLIVLLILASLGAMGGLCVGMGFLFAFIIEKWFAPLFYREVIQPAWKGTEKGSEAIAAGTVGFGRIMLIGFKAVKSNTCPKIEVEE